MIWNQERELAGLDQAESHDLSAAIEVGIEALKQVLPKEKGKDQW